MYWPNIPGDPPKHCSLLAQLAGAGTRARTKRKNAGLPGAALLVDNMVTRALCAVWAVLLSGLGGAAGAGRRAGGGGSWTGTAAAGLREHPIATPAPAVYLDGAWSLCHSTLAAFASRGGVARGGVCGAGGGVGGDGPASHALHGTVPGDILTDLQRAGVMGDPYYNTTWQEPAFIAAWNTGVWTYTTTFDAGASVRAGEGRGVGGDGGRGGEAAATLLLVLDGVRTGAVVRVNGVDLGNATDAWLRYEFALDAARHRLTARGNVVAVTFGAELSIDTGGRRTLSDKIDWAPAMLTRTGTPPRPTFGFGISGSVYLATVPARGCAIRHFAPHTFYLGGHPTSFVRGTHHAGFNVSAVVDLVAGGAGCAGVVSVAGTWPGAAPVSQRVTVGPGARGGATLLVPGAQTLGAALWQPNGHGEQVLYNITATFTPDPSPGAGAGAPGAPGAADAPGAPGAPGAARGGGAAAGGGGVATSTRRLGFRHIALVTTDDTDPAAHGATAREVRTKSTPPCRLRRRNVACVHLSAQPWASGPSSTWEQPRGHNKPRTVLTGTCFLGLFHAKERVWADDHVPARQRRPRLRARRQQGE